MSDTVDKEKEKDIESTVQLDQGNGEVAGNNSLIPDEDEHPMPTPQQEEETLKKKYGGVIPKKKPLITKDHERAFFDSADWALGKQGKQKPKGPLEALRPKLQPTPHQQARARRSTYASDGSDDAVPNDDETGKSENEQNVDANISAETKSGQE